MATQIKINGREYIGFENLNMNIQFDTMAGTFSFNGYFDESNPIHQRIFRPLTYNNIEIIVDGQLFLTGVMLSHTFDITAKNALVPVSGYAKPGVLNDCDIPTSLYPLEISGKNLREITETLIEPFGISLVVDPAVEADVEKVYEKTTAKSGQRIGNYISQLASQRNVIVSHTPKGELLFTRPTKQTKAVATYVQGMPSVRIGCTVNGQGLHSQITVLKQAKVGSDAEGGETLINPLIPVFRPLVKEQTKGDAGDTVKAAQNVLASELKSISFTVSTDRWYWTDGRTLDLIGVNNYVGFRAERASINRIVNMFVKGVVYNETDKERTAVLTLVLPETFNDQVPKNIFT